MSWMGLFALLRLLLLFFYQGIGICNDVVGNGLPTHSHEEANDGDWDPQHIVERPEEEIADRLAEGEVDFLPLLDQDNDPCQEATQVHIERGVERIDEEVPRMIARVEADA